MHPARPSALGLARPEHTPIPWRELDEQGLEHTPIPKWSAPLAYIPTTKLESSGYSDTTKT